MHKACVKMLLNIDNKNIYYSVIKIFVISLKFEGLELLVAQNFIIELTIKLY